ncbi:MAG TPA: tetratricopeptide repeat protein [Streptosporangiaceae bacterium]|jgi:predicted ATPase/DNA-binding CsgD family transcriptional regulator|nr:tetratricopeptide repeat protein [Streptosporangiaceae bacterium]
MITAEQHNLHEEPNRFIGRERELGELRASLLSSRALTLCGTGGIGKTRLAGRILAALRDEFPDGVWMVELGDLQQPDLVVSRVASVVGVTEENGRPLLDTLADALAARSLLVALDNCEHLIDAAARVCQRLLAGAPGLRIIATSREPLRVAAETVWQVPPLTVPPPPPPPTSVADLSASEAAALFADRAAAALPSFTVTGVNAAAVGRLCRALEGLPLAIELAAAWVRMLSAEQIEALLHDRFRLLATQDRTVPARQRTLRATIDWSHDLLTPDEQALFRRLSVFTGWSLEMAEEVCSDEQLPVANVLDLITALVDKSLVAVEPEVLGQSRYRMLDAIKEYAAEQLTAAGEAEQRQQLLRDYTLRVAEHNMAIGMALIPGPWSARVDVFRRYDIDTVNVDQVLSRCMARGDVEGGLRICTGVRPCWIVRGRFAEGMDWFDSFLALDAPGLPDRVRGAALAGRAQLAMPSDPAEAERGAREALALCVAAGDSFWTATTLNLLAEAALHLGRPDEAAARATEALELARESGDPFNEGYALGSLATAAGLRFNLRDAEEFGLAALAVMRRIDQQWGAARTMIGLGDLARLRSEPEVARRYYTEALPVFREINARPEIARTLAGLARVALEQKDHSAVEEFLGESLVLSHSTGSRIGVARGLEAFAGLSAAQDEAAHAVRLIAAAASLRDAAGLRPLSGARIGQYLSAAGPLGEAAVTRLWEEGAAMTPDQAVALALSGSGAGAVGRPAVEGAAGSGGPGGGGAAGAVAGLPNQLTPRERQIIELIAAGLSNRQIAEELVIAPATAARHVANILAKLEFSSRSQIAAWAKSARN